MHRSKGSTGTEEREVSILKGGKTRDREGFDFVSPSRMV